ncbi:PIG-L deacetylase family protein [Luteibacter sahnii]|uniref:PIG-L deacetylase family protein n=1 Tax=Luteibacter sahnii TaxID=3021977 RepID=UPI002A6B3392|nr:PIG-L family deacetylase [Luteibacter sp. PPL193]MDY1547824.1 PIG-L family deacetylase [Luteibacter sp. PPL193]
MPDLLPIDRQTRLLVVAPHPDDETLGAGLLIQRVLATGGDVDVLLLTDGDDNPWPQRWLERRVFIGRRARARWGRRRRGEALAALGRLGVTADRLHALGWHDMQVTRALRCDHGVAVKRVGEVVAGVRPTLVLLPALSDTHPDHSAAHVLVRLALWEARSAAAVLTYAIHGGAACGAAAPLLVDAAHLATKMAAMGEHITQMALSRERMMGYARRPEIHRAAPPAGAGGLLRLPWHPGPIARARLRVMLSDGQGTVVWPWRRAPLACVDGDWVLTLREPAGPAFVKLTADMATPWIHDRYGWTCRGLAR